MSEQTKDPLDALCGERVLEYVCTDVRHPFNADSEGIAFGFSDITMMFFQNPSDGYRSGHYAPLVTQNKLYELSGYSATPVDNAPVMVARWTKSLSGSADGLAIIDTRNGRVIALVGTDNTDDYYPYWVGKWAPHNLATNGSKAAPGGSGFYALEI